MGEVAVSANAGFAQGEGRAVTPERCKGTSKSSSPLCECAVTRAASTMLDPLQYCFTPRRPHPPLGNAVAVTPLCGPSEAHTPYRALSCPSRPCSAMIAMASVCASTRRARDKSSRPKSSSVRWRDAVLPCAGSGSLRPPRPRMARMRCMRSLTGSEPTAERVGETTPCAAPQAPAGVDEAGRRRVQSPAATQQPVPQAMVLGNRDIAPAARIQVGVGTYSQIGAVHMRVGAIRPEVIGPVEALLDLGQELVGIEP